MKKTLFFARRNWLEMRRDPISLFFGVAFPIILLLLLSLIDRSIPAEAQMHLFEIENLAPGIAVFSLSFLTLFSAMLISKDRTSAFVLRLYCSPLSGSGFILGYVLPLLPMAAAQMAVCFLAAVLMGLTVSWNILLCIAVSLPIMVFYIAIGLLCGTLLSEKAVGGACGALLTNVSAWLSGTWFSLDLIGGVFRKVAYCLPFANAVDAARAALAGRTDIWKNLWIVLAWAFAAMLLAVVVFARRRKAK